MATVVDWLGLLAIVLIHAVVAALMTRFFRVRLRTRLGAAVYSGLAIPFVLVVGTLVFGGVLGLGPNLGSPAAVIGATVIVPLAIGLAFDYFWMPAPDEVDLPAEREDPRPRSRR
ncbi:MAG: hypothetical protein ABEH64_08620 [Salinirussus sp.]